MLLPLAIVSAVFLLVLLALALSQRVIAKIAARNAFRRKRTSLLIVMGLMIGTALISSSLVIQDTMYYTFRKDVYDRLHEIDEAVISPDSNGTYRFFDISVYDNLSLGLKERSGDRVDGTAPLILLWLPVMDTSTGYAEPRALVIGFDASRENAFGEEGSTFDTPGGKSIEANDLAPGEVMMNARCAAELDAASGDDLTVFYGERKLNFTLRHVLADSGFANMNEEFIMFVPLKELQARLGMSDAINYIKISNRGGVEDGHVHTENVKRTAQEVLASESGSPAAFTVDTMKSDSLDLARELSGFIGDVFTIMGAFVAMAGLVLIMLIFVMLAEERRTESGISRAVGMRRGKLMLSYLLEGAIYSILAVAAGALSGLGISYVILYFMELRSDMIFHFEVESILLSAVLGLLSTLTVIAIASWLVSKINIVRAIRKLPEPLTRGKRRIFVPVGCLLSSAGAVLSVFGIMRHLDPAVESDVYLIWGFVVSVIGLAIILFQYLSPRIVFTIAGALMVFWSLNPLLEYKGTGPEMFISSGIVLVPGGVLVLVFNSSPILSALDRLFSLGRKRKNLPVIRIGTSYPLKKRFRTGMILVIFTLVIFATSVEAIFTHLEMESVRRTPEKQSRRYDIVCTVNPLNPVLNITDRIERSPVLDIGDFREITPLVAARAEVRKNGTEDEPVPMMVLGVDREFGDENRFKFHSIAPGYWSADDVWNAVLSNSSLAVMDRSIAEVEWDPFFGPFSIVAGQSVTVRAPDGRSANLTVVGILETFMVREIRGIYVGQELVASFFGVTRDNMYLVNAAEGVDIQGLSRNLEREFMANGMRAEVMMDDVNMFLDSERSIVTLMQGYMAVGLVVGIAGLAIITVRSVAERRREIGIVRAIGFTRGMVTRSFLVENVFVVCLACILGAAMAIGIAHRVYLKMFASDVPFLIPWLNLAFIAAIAILGTLLTSLAPARSASKIPPAEAVRYMD